MNNVALGTPSWAVSDDGKRTTCRKRAPHLQGAAYQRFPLKTNAAQVRSGPITRPPPFSPSTATRMDPVSVSPLFEPLSLPPLYTEICVAAGKNRRRHGQSQNSKQKDMFHLILVS